MLRLVSAVIVGAVAISAAVVARDNREPRGPSDSADISQAPAPQPATFLTPSKAATMHDAPQGKELGRLSPGATLATLTRERGWVRVRMEGWINEDQLVPLDSALRMSPSAADIRADPAGMKGKLVRWDVEFISWLRADPLRRDMKADEWYILARGPGTENAISYLVVPPNLKSAAESITPLSRIVVTARVRVGRSAPVGVPILDVESISKR